ALAPLVRPDAGEARLRLGAGGGTSPDELTLTSSAGAATNRGVRFEALAQASSSCLMRTASLSPSVSSVPEIACVVARPVMWHPALQRRKAALSRRRTGVR